MEEPATNQSIKLEDLKPGMKFKGKVVKTELFGAFVDIGAEREGLVHISMIKKGKVNRVEDEVKPGDEVEVWVHKTDIPSGRLELSMRKPLDMEWKDIEVGSKVKGKVVRIESFGAFVDIGAERPGLVHVSELKDEYVADTNDVVSVNDEVEVTILEVNRKKRQIRLSMKDSSPQEYLQEMEEEEAEEVPTAMEIALRQALNDSQDEVAPKAAKKSTAKSKSNDLEDILSRTLKDRVSPTTES
ncbi:MAG: S1 RNA-binding domain-containing protein [Anaerolineales bacterium]